LLAHFLIAARHVPAGLAQTTDHNNQLIASPVGRA
jgi:hypothetical protein